MFKYSIFRSGIIITLELLRKFSYQDRGMKKSGYRDPRGTTWEGKEYYNKTQEIAKNTNNFDLLQT